MTVFSDTLVRIRKWDIKKSLNSKMSYILKKLIFFFFTDLLCAEMYTDANKSVRNILVNVVLCTHVYAGVGGCLFSMVC